ncbi:MAG TPA: metalloregulator ArsR/SmtB family transcription factor [Gammaproteobacteria bacterium]|nr:metalloregulator ArsR/SmtB family transcription factor [Gammaproteobacteria bacterium]
MTVSSRETQHRLFAHFAQVAEGLGHGYRLALLEILAQGERDVETLARVTGLSVASVSQHLQRLKRTGLVTARREGRRRIYQLSSPRVSALVSSLERMAEECVAEVDKLVGEVLRARDPQAPLSARELAALVKKGRVTVLDVRPVEEYAAGHLPGAINVPLESLRRRIKELPRSRPLVVYCRGPYCVLTLDALELLQGKGFKVRRLADSVADWRRAGLPVEAGSVEHPAA